MFQSPGAVAIKIGSLSIHWYGILIALGFLLALHICTKVAKEKGEKPELFTDMASIVLLTALVGARLYYVAFNWDYYSTSPLDIIKIWQGGLAIHGGIIGGLIGGFFFTRYHKLSFAKYCDITCVGLILAQAIGRWGNFFNSEAFGSPTNLPWKLYIPMENRPDAFVDNEFFHPTFLYESIWNFATFLILYFVLRKKFENYNGALFFCYMAIYSLGRFFIEGLRTDSLMLFGEFRIAQVISICFVVIAIWGLDKITKKKPVLIEEENKPHIDSEKEIT